MTLSIVPRPQMRKRRKVELGVDTNLMDLYLYICGKSEIPEAWHKWCLIALVAASVGKRVAFQKFGHQTLWPNLFIFLIGPSGLGKGGAISHMLQLEHMRHNTLNGASTHRALIQRFAQAAPEGHPGYESVFMIHEELGNSIPSGNLGRAFIKFVTDGFQRAGDYYTDATRRDGEVSFPKPCINWLAGSTPQWLGESVSLNDMLSGFFGRVVGVPAWYNFDERVYMPSRFDPPDREDVLLYLCQRIHWLTMIPEGSIFEMDLHAMQVDEEWYLNRPEPQDERLYPWWRRESDLALKLAMIMSLCRGQSLHISVEDITQAHELVREARDAMPRIIQWATRSALNETELVIETYLQAWKGRWMRRTSLSGELRKRNVSVRVLDEALETLIACGFVETRNRSKTIEYRWCDTSRKFQFGSVSL